jgi:parvulin-like peptidyl-prolyl isomerase
MRRTLFVVVLVALVLTVPLLASCGEKKVPQGAIAAVGDGVVSQEQFDEIMEQAQAQYASQEGAPPFPEEGTAEYNQLVASIVNYLVQNEIVNQNAEELGVEVTADELDARLKEITQQVGGKKELTKLLEEQNVTEEQLREQLTAQMLLDEVRQKVYEDVEITDEQAQAYYDDPENTAQFDQPETRDMRHVLTETKVAAENALDELEADPTSDKVWESVAKEYSTDPGTKDKGGELGSWPSGRMVPEFDEVAFELEVDELSKPVKSPFGWHVIQVTKITPGQTQTFDEAKEMIKQTLLFQEQAKAWEEWLKAATDEAEVVYAPGFNPDQLTAQPSPAEEAPLEGASPEASPSPEATEE